MIDVSSAQVATAAVGLPLLNPSTHWWIADTTSLASVAAAGADARMLTAQATINLFTRCPLL